MFSNDTIVALSTPQGVGAIAVIRVSGGNSFDLLQQIFRGKNLKNQLTHTIVFGKIVDKEQVIDDVLVSIFKGPNSFTKEDVVEISCHGSNYIIQKIIELLIKQGARYAKPGEFTQRAFLNGRFNLAQAEAVADLIHSDSESAHLAAIKQMRGGFAAEIKVLREQLVTFASLIELELDFAEEDVAFANRSQLKSTVLGLLQIIFPLIDSFQFGNAIKNGVPVAIIGKPNAGKSTLLNTLLNEEKAIVSEIAGTTRDAIEDEIIINGFKIRFIDTAGLRITNDKLETIGIERTMQKIQEASLIIYLFDVTNNSIEDLKKIIKEIKSFEKPFLLVGNKIDFQDYEPTKFESLNNTNALIFISANKKNGIENLKSQIIKAVNLENFKTGNSLVTNIRHYESFLLTKEALERVLFGIDSNQSTELIAEDIREALYQLGLVTGEVTNDEILGNIFSKFCIGK
ncbi:MAG: tRNA uridine-5-carboxymethylaminomethyl(34) synthesis GTPase MnmE [Bacteroidota bacterium]|nr:tRNA uridine-5-carboxymethylaminomethyl(34) synthesis GTPase MnmE [Bacteroidota bacterium]